MSKFFILLLSSVLLSCATTGVHDKTKECSKPPVEKLAGQPNSTTNRLGELVMWKKGAFPIEIVVDPGMRVEKRKNVWNAINEWNLAVGLPVFMYSEGIETLEEGKVWLTEKVLPKTECGNQIFGLAYRYTSSNVLGISENIIQGKIEIHLGVPNGRVHSTLVHELGHILGLHHDPEINSIMYPMNMPERGDITNEDIKYVRKMIL